MRNELIADYTLLNEYPSMNEKKALATKYGIESKKAKEIQEMVLVAMRGERKTRTEFDEIDLRYFSLFDIPETYAKAVPYYELESIEFLNYVLNIYWGNVVEKKLENNCHNNADSNCNHKVLDNSKNESEEKNYDVCPVVVL